MIDLRKILIVPTAAAVLVGGGLLLAQPGGEPVEEAPEVTVPNMGKTAKVSPAQMRETATSTMTEIRDMLARLVELRQVARQSKDVIKLNCVNDKMLLFKQLVNIAEAAQTSMTEAIAQGDEPGRYHNYGQVVLAKEKAEGLRSDAEGCIGEEMIFLGPTQVRVNGPNIDDDLNTPYDWFDLDDPKYSTPFN